MANIITGVAKPVNTTLPIQMRLVGTSTWVDGALQSDGTYLCTLTSVPAGTYAAGTVEYRLKGSNPVVNAFSTNAITVVDAGSTPKPDLPVLVAADGDSTTFGTYSSDPYPDQLQRLLKTTNYTVKNFGNPGAVSQNALNDVATKVDSQYSATTYSFNLYPLLIGVNDALNGVPITTAKSNIEKLHRDRIAKGWKTIACTILPTTQPVGSYLAELNTHIKNNYQSWGCSGLCDYAAEPLLGNPSDTSVYSDGLHPIALGDTYMARLMKRTIDRVMTALGGPVTPADLLSLSISGPTAVYENSSTPFPITGTYSDGTTSQNTGATLATTEGTITNGALNIPADAITGNSRTATLTATKGSITATKYVTVNDGSAPTGAGLSFNSQTAQTFGVPLDLGLYDISFVFKRNIPWGESFFLDMREAGTYYLDSATPDTQAVLAYAGFPSGAAWSFRYINPGSAARRVVIRNLNIPVSGLITFLQRYTSGQGMECEIADFTVHNRPLTNTEVASLTGGSQDIPTNGLIRRYAMAAGTTGTVLTDISGNGKNGTLSGF